MTDTSLLRTMSYNDVAKSCIGCGKPADVVVSLKDGESICRPCTEKVLAVFRANHVKVREHVKWKRARRLRRTRGGPLRKAKLVRARP